MRYTISLGIGIACLACASWAKIEIKVATDSLFAAKGDPWVRETHGKDTTLCPTSVGAAWYRYAGMKCMRDDLVETFEGCVDLVQEFKSTMPFEHAVNEEFRPEYVVYGRAEQFSVPDSGSYTFHVKSDVTAVIMIDGNQLKTPWAQISSHPGDTIGTVSGTEKQDYSTTIDLDAGDHLFEFIYFSSYHTNQSRFFLFWLPPGATEEQLVPPSAFGGGLCPVTSLTSEKNAGLKQNFTYILNNTLSIPKTIENVTSVRILDRSGKNLGAMLPDTDKTWYAARDLTPGIYILEIKTVNGQHVVPALSR